MPTKIRKDDGTYVDADDVAVQGAAVADAAALTVGTNIAAFTDPPSAAEMATLRTFVNALKADITAVRTAHQNLLGELETSGALTPN